MSCARHLSANLTNVQICLAKKAQRITPLFERGKLPTFSCYTNSIAFFFRQKSVDLRGNKFYTLQDNQKL